MIIPDSSVWIDLLNNRVTVQSVRLRELLSSRFVIGVADLVLVEVLQGTRDEHDFETTLATMTAYDQVTVVDAPIAALAARNHQALRARGVTPRKTVDTLIATRCIVDNIPLLFADRDFLPFVEHLNLRSALDDTGLN